MENKWCVPKVFGAQKQSEHQVQCDELVDKEGIHPNTPSAAICDLSIQKNLKVIPGYTMFFFKVYYLLLLQKQKAVWMNRFHQQLFNGSMVEDRM